MGCGASANRRIEDLKKQLDASEQEKSALRRQLEAAERCNGREATAAPAVGGFETLGTPEPPGEAPPVAEATLASGDEKTSGPRLSHESSAAEVSPPAISVTDSELEGDLIKKPEETIPKPATPELDPPAPVQEPEPEVTQPLSEAAKQAAKTALADEEADGEAKAPTADAGDDASPGPCGMLAGAPEDGEPLEPEDSIIPGVVVWEAPPEKVAEEAALDSQEAETGTSEQDASDDVVRDLPKDFKDPEGAHKEDGSGKLSNSIDSTASTCTPSATPAAADRSALQESQEVSTSSAPPGLASPASCCNQCNAEAQDLYVDPSDMNRYCESCWIEYYGHPPGRGELMPLVGVEVEAIWPEDRLAQLWAERPLHGWPPLQQALLPAPMHDGAAGEVWSNVNVRIRRDVVGPHAREQTSNSDRPFPGELLSQRYRVRTVVGEGHFTKAFLADDLQTKQAVCLKRHRNLSVEALTDLLVISKRMAEVDPDGGLFPQMIDSFYDLVGFTVESLVEGRNCLSVAQSSPSFFHSMGNLRVVALGTLQGLVYLDRAGIVHNDVKPDNLIWVEDQGGVPPGPTVKIVDFGCARLDQREEHGRNWSLAEGGAGHLGKWSPEMALRLPITTKGDVWGMAVSLCELHCGRCVWRNESDTAEVVLAQSLGLCNLRDGVPQSLLRRSPLDVRQLYTPASRHLPVRQNALGQLEALRPTRWGLDQVLGEGWQENEKADLGDLIQRALVVDPAVRPAAADLLDCCLFVASPMDSMADGPMDSRNSGTSVEQP